MERDSNEVCRFVSTCSNCFVAVEFCFYLLRRILCVDGAMSLLLFLYEVPCEGIYKGGSCLWLWVRCIPLSYFASKFVCPCLAENFFDDCLPLTPVFVGKIVLVSPFMVG